VAKDLTKAALDNLKPGARRREVPDGHTRGLYLVLQTTGAASWAVRYRVAGRNRKLTLGPYPQIELKAARDMARKALAQIAAGSDPAADKQIKKAAARASADDLVETAVEQFIRRHVKPLKSAREAERLLRREVLAPWKTRRLAEITRRDVHKLIDGVLDRPAPILANRVRTHLKRFFAWAVERGLVQSSPVDSVRTPTTETPRDRVLDDDELRALWTETEALGSPFGPALQLLILTGQRLGEVAGMRWDELDTAARLWSLPKERVKNARSHTVPLSPQALAIIEGMPRIENCPYVFTANDRTAVSGFSKIKRRLDSRLPANMAPWRLHDIRRSTATGLARIGTDVAIIERVLNHAGGVFRGVVGTYQRHGFDDERRVALERWGRHVETLAAGEGSNVVELERGRGR
jgi:integrase